MSHATTVERPDLFFEDFTEGQEFPTVTKGPMMVGHQVRWAGACDNYDSEFHHDEYVAKAQGLPGIILSGPLMASYLMTELERWLGRNAQLTRFADRNTGSTMPRDLAHLHGRVWRWCGSRVRRGSTRSGSASSRSASACTGRACRIAA